MSATKFSDECLEYVRTYLNSNLSEDIYTYHNFEHIKMVYKAIIKLTSKLELDSTEKENLLIAAAFHDIGFHKDVPKHEEISADMAGSYLAFHISTERIQKIKELILATKLDWQGSNVEAYILRDADLSNLASKDYFAISERLRREKESLSEKEIDQLSWLSDNISFFRKHRYQSEAGIKRYKKRKRKNLKKLEAMHANKLESTQTIASSKSAQTQLKTALRNHIDLSSIADNKANIMLSVNAIVITVGLPLLADRMINNPKLIIPTAILALTSVVSMIYATLATRPIKMIGKTNLDSIPEKKSNLFFFGNYYQMKFEDYEIGIKQVIADSAILDNSITRDLFFLGKSLGDKYDRLRICYNVFMVGLVLSVLSFVIISFIS